MKTQRFAAMLFCALALTGCKNRSVPPETPMPKNTVLLSAMMRELSAQPGFTQAMLAEVEGAKSGSAKHGPALLTPALADELRQRILGADWEGLDRFPGWTMREINPTVRVVGHVAGKDEKLEAASAVHPGAAPQLAAVREWLSVGPYVLDRAQTISLAQPSTLPGFSTQGIVTPLGDGVVRGDGPNPQLAPEHADSQRLADVLNRLAVNPEAQSFAVQAVPGAPDASSPEALLRELAASGHTVTVTDSRYFANFGHLHFRGQDVMMPFWVNTQIAVPGTGGLFTRPRPLLVPVSHAELEWHIRGPRTNADVSWYFGIDGHAEWRTMDTLDQAWVGKRDAHTWSGDDAVEVTRLAAAFTRAYMHLHAHHPALPFGGYYALGVCQDAVSAVEHRMTGHVTLFPNTADAALFNDPRDAEVNAMIHAIPKDREGTPPEPERVFGSLPFAPAQEGAHAFDAITIPGLAQDLNVTYAAWRAGKLQRTHGWFFYTALVATLAAGIGIVLAASVRRRKR